MEKQEETFEDESEKQQQRQQERHVKEEALLRFLDSTDSYLILLDSLSSTLRQGWLELASARHSMGASRVNSALLDLKVHSAATSLQISHQDVDSMFEQHRFVLRKGVSFDNGESSCGEEEFIENKLQKESDHQLRHRNSSHLSEEEASERNGSSLTLDKQIQKQRSKSLSVFGALVSPKLRAAQISFETALEILVEIANMRSIMLATFDQVHKGLKALRDDKDSDF